MVTYAYSETKNNSQMLETQAHTLREIKNKATEFLLCHFRFNLYKTEQSKRQNLIQVFILLNRKQ